MRFLIFVSLAAHCLFTACSPKVAPISGNKPDITFWLPQQRDSIQRNNYRIIIDTDNINISGFWIVKRVDETWSGTMINEFGFKMFDFTCTAKKCKLLNVVAIMDKWYIKKTIAGDVQFMLEIDNPEYKTGRKTDRQHINDSLTISYKKEKMLQRFVTGEMTMHNRKHNLKYSFKKME